MNFKKIMATAIIGTMCLSGVACSKQLPAETTPTSASAEISTTAPVKQYTGSWYRATGFELTSIEFTGSTMATTKDGESLPQVAEDKDVKLVVVSPELVSAGINKNIDVQFISFNADGVADKMDGLQPEQYTVTTDEATGTLTITFNDDIVEEGKTAAFTISATCDINPELMYADKGFVAIIVVGDATKVSFNNAGQASEPTESSSAESGESSETSETSEASETSETT